MFEIARSRKNPSCNLVPFVEKEKNEHNHIATHPEQKGGDLVRKLIFVLATAVLLAIGATLTFASSQTESQSYTCPLTGQELPCPNCCPVTK